MSEQNNKNEERKERKVKELIPIDFTRFATPSMKTAEERRLEEEQKSLDGKQEGNSAGNTDGNKHGNTQGNNTSNSTSNTDGNLDVKKQVKEPSNSTGNEQGNMDGKTDGNDTRNMHGDLHVKDTGKTPVDLPSKETRKYKKRSSILDEIRSEKKTRNKITIYLDRDIDDALKEIAGTTRGGMKSEYINRILREQMVKDGLLDEE